MPALPPPPDRNPETIRQATQQYTAIIESAIRKDPDQWIWIHRRWRTKPLPEPLAVDPAAIAR
jgi:KDO2-lipid IV(A) lauroyltransferase